MSKYVIYSLADGHIIDTADSAMQAHNRSWWRKGARVVSASWYARFVQGVLS